MNKICTKCGKNKTLDDFHKDGSKKDGRKTECKSCTYVINKRYRETDKGKLVHAKTHAKYYKTDKGKLTKAKADAKYTKTDKGKATAARRNHNRRTNIENTLNTLTVKEFNCILFLQSYKCANPNCKCKYGGFFDMVEPQKDHIYPVSKGGNFTKETVQALCQSCNSKKSTQYIDLRSDYHKEIITRI